MVVLVFLIKSYPMNEFSSKYNVLHEKSVCDWYAFSLTAKNLKYASTLHNAFPALQHWLLNSVRK